MRSKNLVPVGQGCKRQRHTFGEAGKSTAGKCACHPDLYFNICLGCGEWFHSVAPHAKTCGDKCRKRWSRARHEKLFQSVLNFADGVA